MSDPSVDVPVHSSSSASQETAAEVAERLIRNIGYEVMPFKGTEESVVKHVPPSVPLTVTTTQAKGTGATLDLTERLSARGYDVAPHLAARQIRDEVELDQVVERLDAAGVTRAFVIGGDAPDPVGKYTSALELFHDLDVIDHGLVDIGIGGYPEGHGAIAEDLVREAIRHKQQHARRIVSQICFDARTTAEWGESLVVNGVELPVFVGMPGPVNRQKLVRISAGLGLGQSARFLQKQQGLWRFLLPGAYKPTRLARALAREVAVRDTRIKGLHIFTFNELEGTEKWRQGLLSRLQSE